MRMKKLAALAMCTAMIGGLLSGCGSQNTPKDSGTTAAAGTTAAEAASANEGGENASADISGKLVLWEHATNFEESLKPIIEEFQKQYPNVEIEYEVKSTDYYSLLATAIQSGDAPDVFWTNGTATSQMADYVKNDVLCDLTDKVDFSALEEKSLDLAKVDNKLYSVPWMTFDTRTCYYNKDMFEENGWTVPKTFDEYEALLQKIKDANIIPLSICPNNTWSVLFAFEPLLAAMEPEYTRGLSDYSVKANAPEVGNVWNKMIEWSKKGFFGEDYLGVADGDAQSLAFTMNQAAMTISGSWEITSYQQNNPDLNLGAFQIPAQDGTTGMVGAYANGFSVNKNSEYIDAALAFVNYCASLEAQTIWVQALGAVSGSPDIESNNDVAKEIAKCDETFTSWQSVLSKYAKEGESPTTIWEEDSVKLLSEDVTPEQLLESIGEVMQ